jgi:hypothetical protein
MEDLAKQL